MSPELITALVSLLVVSGGGLSWWIKRRDAARDPLPRSAAEVAMAKEALGIVKASNDTLVADVARLREDRDDANRRLDDVEGEAHSLRQEVQALRQEMHSIRTVWTAWYRDLTEHWAVHREQATPPTPPTAD